MKIRCIRSTQIAGVGIVRAGEIVTVPDAYAADPRVQVNFKVVEGPKGKQKQEAKPPTDEDVKARCIKGILALGIAQVKDALANNGIQFDPKAEDKAVAAIYYENFGFNTEPAESEAVPE